MDHTVQEKSEMLDKTQWSQDFSWEEIRDMARHMVVCKAEKGITVCMEGAFEAYMCVIVRGSVKVLKEDIGSRRKVMASLSSSEYLGEMSLIDGSPRSATAIADEDTILLVLTREEFNGILEETPRLGLKLLLKMAKSMSQRLRQPSGLLVAYLQKC